jgi:hypothetical protein
MPSEVAGLPSSSCGSDCKKNPPSAPLPWKTAVTIPSVVWNPGSATSSSSLWMALMRAYGSNAQAVVVKPKR